MAVSMDRDLKPILIIVAVVAVVIIGFMALRGTSREVEMLPEVDLGSPGDTTPTGGPLAVVIGALQRGGGGFLWFDRGDPTNIVTVQFYAPAACGATVSFDDAWPTQDPGCRSEVPISGVVSGLGTAPTGETIVAVDAEVGDACFETVDLGDYWPIDGCP
jgi:hypothetical protein